MSENNDEPYAVAIVEFIQQISTLDELKAWIDRTGKKCEITNVNVERKQGYYELVIKGVSKVLL